MTKPRTKLESSGKPNHRVSLDIRCIKRESSYVCCSMCVDKIGFCFRRIGYMMNL